MQIFIKGISRQKECSIQTINDMEETDSTRILYIILKMLVTCGYTWLHVLFWMIYA